MSMRLTRVESVIRGRRPNPEIEPMRATYPIWNAHIRARLDYFFPSLKSSKALRHTSKMHSSRADVVQHLLDPSYYSSQSSYHHQPRVYIDRKGNMHDPDYRHFPVVSSYPLTSPIDDDDEYIDPFAYHAPRRSSSLSRRQYYPSPSPSSSPSSSSSPDESPFDDLASPEKCQGNVVKKALCRRRERRRASLDSYVLEEEEEAAAQVSDDEEEQVPELDESHVPTCGEALKRQWQSISFALTFRVFRARRRLKRVLSH